METQSVIIIGAGLAGLSAGCYAQMNGYRSQIYEHHTVPGGVAACWRRKGYLIDGGIHFLMAHKPGSEIYTMYSELGATQGGPFPDMATYGHFVDQASGRELLVTRDLQLLREEMKALFPQDGELIDDLIDNSQRMQGAGMSMGMGKPPELTTPLDSLRELWSMRRFVRYFTGRYARPVRAYAQAAADPWLRWVIEMLFLPEVPVWFLFLLLGMVAEGQIGLLPEGSLGFVLPIERRYRALGGQVTYGATVEEILVEADPRGGKDRAVGVRLADGSEHRADVVVSAADGHSTLYGMLGGRYVDAKTERRYQEWPLIRPGVMVSYGVDRQFAGEPWLHMIRLQEPLLLAERAIEALSLRIFNYSDHFAPAGKTVLQALFEHEWDYWNDLRTASEAAYREEKARVADEVLVRLERHFPGLAAAVEMTDVATPYTTWRYTRNHRGAYMGWMPTPEALLTTIPRTLPELEDFYMAGQWMLPGGGVPPCLYSGRHVVELLCRRDRRPFVAMRPA